MLKKHLLWLLLIAFIQTVSAQDITTGLQVHYAFDNNVVDSTLNTTATNNNATFGTDKWGNAGKALSVDFGSGVSIADAPQTRLDSIFTVSLWLKMDTAADNYNNSVFVLITQNLLSDYGLIVNNMDSMWFYMNEACPGTQMIASSRHSNWTDWNHIVIQSNDSSFSTYFNGALVATSPLSCNSLQPLFTPGVPFNVNDPNAPGKFWIDELRIYNRLLSASDLNTLYNYQPVFPSAVESTQSDKPILLYPNPIVNGSTQSFLTVSLPDDLQSESVIVVDILGKVALSQNNMTNNSLDCSQLPQGLYTIQVKASGKWFTAKFVKQ